MKVWLNYGKVIMQNGKVILCDSCPCEGCRSVGLTVKDKIPHGVDTDEPQYYKCETIGPFDFDGWMHIEGFVDDDFRIKIGGSTVYSGTELAHNISETFTFSAGDRIEIELVEANYKHHPTGGGGAILCFFSGSIIVCPEWVDRDKYLNDEDFE